ncbi:hypothetical protein PRIPAC_93945 [Pristionchus pacificus]|uniref:Uncharacterized protein n=1 Tax=Pristionchus pacificus TaxID=54126 RepID=A0A2A6BRB6_PRIPA|nr:hypothetical protein PRIPAC_93945 [Pristionchus pacificus]|eukprot:PDM68407.1 hypothetical protein PRIPAC_46451 [Pristionchus pacificus]
MTSVDSSKDLKTVPFQTHEPEDPNYTHFSILIPTDQETVDGYFAIKLDNAFDHLSREIREKESNVTEEFASQSVLMNPDQEIRILNFTVGKGDWPK